MPITVQSPCFFHGGASPGIPTCQHKVVVGESWRACACNTPFGMEGSASLLLSGLCRLRASSLPREQLSRQSQSPRVHTRNKHSTCSVMHPLTHFLPPPSSSLPLPSSSPPPSPPPPHPTHHHHHLRSHFGSSRGLLRYSAAWVVSCEPLLSGGNTSLCCPQVFVCAVSGCRSSWIAPNSGSCGFL